MADFIEKLRSDIVEQFKNRPNIEALVSVIGEQLQAVYEFYEQLELEREISKAVGKQLDGIGNIVDLTRLDAGRITGSISSLEVLDDEKYRRLLIFKILKNTSATTYPEIIKAFKMFWDRPLYYTETPDEPATMRFDTGEMDATDEVIDTTPLFGTPLIRAAGVTLKLNATTKTDIDTALIHIGSSLGYACSTTELPELERDIDYGTVVHIGTAASSITIDDMQAGTTMTTPIDGVTIH